MQHPAHRGTALASHSVKFLSGRMFPHRLDSDTFQPGIAWLTFVLPRWHARVCIHVAQVHVGMLFHKQGVRVSVCGSSASACLQLCGAGLGATSELANTCLSHTQQT